jgi:hypothetical protein
MDYSFIDIELRKARAKEDKVSVRMCMHACVFWSRGTKSHHHHRTIEQGVRLDLRWLFCQGGNGGCGFCEDVACGTCCESGNAQHKRKQRQVA